MSWVLDASVAVAAARPVERSHATALTRVRSILAREVTIVVPALFRVEVASALTRAGADVNVVSGYVDRLLVAAEVVTLGPVRSRQIQRVAVAQRLRAADAAYVWLAGERGLPFVTLDKEVLGRAAPVCVAEAP